jgi:hypothetical protein
LCSEIGGETIKARKKPGPHPEKPLDTEIKFRADKETVEKIEYCKEKLNTNRSDVLRKGVHFLYDDLNKK